MLGWVPPDMYFRPWLLIILSTRVVAADVPDFNREVRPILSNYCFKCHGPDEPARKSKLRLDVREAALKPAKSGDRAIVPGKVDESELVTRIFSGDEDETMPPAATKKTLTAEQKDILKRWIAGGAEYQPHWAFVAPRQAPVPAGANPIDFFVRARLASEGFKPSPEADRYTLVRRLSLDLIGLPPSPEEALAFVNDPSPDAYEKLVDRLLASPHYGERWARRWMDLARYSDTNGYEKDRNRSIWPWRDWLIKALNADKPFDQFTIEQLAGDLLPDATRDQIVATGFHRNTMLNEEGGIDPLEYRFHAMTDRVATTGVTWLGLTVGCAQCHTHKFDPIQHREYYQMMAFLNNADEPDLDLPAPDADAREATRKERLAKLFAELPGKWPVEDVRWQTVRPAKIETASGERPTILDDGSALFAAASPEKDTYTITFDSDLPDVTQLRLETLADASLPSGGPGRVRHGNFVLSQITVTAAPKSSPERAETVKLVSAQADAAQKDFPVENAINGKAGSGWAVHVEGQKLNVSRTATFAFNRAVTHPGGTRFVVKLDQQYGNQHTIGRPRLSVGAKSADGPIETRRHDALEAKFTDWLTQERSRAVTWTTLRPVEAKSNLPLLSVQADGSVFVSGDITKSDTYDLKFSGLPRGITAIRLEAMPDDRLPLHGPGMAYYEGPKGDFFMGEFQLNADGKAVTLVHATESFSKNAMGGNPATAALAIDGDPQTGWSASGHEGAASEAVFQLAAPLGQTRELSLRMIFGRHYACSLGRFRVSVTTDPRGAEAREMPDRIAQLLTAPDAKLTASERNELRQHFLLVAPEMAAARGEIDKLRKPTAASATTLVFRERPAENPRPTFLHNRGEFMQPTDRVEPDVLAILPPLPAGAKHDRLAFARWLVSPENPLTARVTVNRQWSILFGRGLVKTTEDFGYQGEPPTHPELLDWLAVEFVKQGWSLKKLHRLIMTSATYRQSSRVTPEGLAADAENRFLARGPRGRLDAEIIRDATLSAAGLISLKIGGASVHPPQPDGVSEVAYGSPKWPASTGSDRFRRGLYTFAKRTAPYAMLTGFDAPTGEACIARRDVSNSPLQALTLLNDVVFIEAAQALGTALAAMPGSVDERIAVLVRRVLSRPASASDTERLTKFFQTQRERFASGALDAKKVAGDGNGDAVDRAAWTTVARAMFNLDEAITKS